MAQNAAVFLTYKCGWRMPGEARRYPAWARRHLRGGSAAAMGVELPNMRSANDNLGLIECVYAPARAHS